ncbi:MAG: ABC transporter ATP-binding protein [Desulfomonilaceae bacterium]
MLLEISRLNAFYDVFQALFSVNIAVEQGEVVCLLGRNGAGKTTTLSSVVGLLPRCTGSIRYKGEELWGQRTYQIARRGISLVPENRLIFSELSVSENLDLACRGCTRKQLLERKSKVLELFDRLSHLLGRDAGTLSGGEQQMLAIGRALMTNPELLLLDELTIGLAPVIVQSFKKHVHSLKDAGITILLTEQNAVFALDVSDRAYVLDKGSIVFDGSVEELRQRKDLMQSFLGVS